MSASFGVSTVTAPELKSVTGEAVAKFDLAYERYLRQIDEVNRDSTTACKIVPAGYKTNMARRGLSPDLDLLWMIRRRMSRIQSVVSSSR